MKTRIAIFFAAAEIKIWAENVSVTISIGSAAGSGQSSVDALLAAADAALY